MLNMRKQLIRNFMKGVGVFVSGLIGDLVKDRYIGAINRWLDTHASGPLHGVASWVVNRPYALTFGFVGIFLAVLITHAFVVTRTKRHAGENERETPEYGPAGIASAEPPRRPLNVRLAPSGGPAMNMVLQVANLGRSAEVSAQCVVTALRVGGVDHQVSNRAFDLSWENESTRKVFLGTQPRNLLIAFVDDDRDTKLPTLRILGLSGKWVKECESRSWNEEPNEALPEYDLEITIYSEGFQPHSEVFTLGPKSWLGPLEMVSKADLESMKAEAELLSEDPRMTVEVEVSGGMGLFPTTGIRVNNVGGSEMQSLKLNDLVISGKTIKFESNIPTIARLANHTVYPILEGASLQQKRNLLGAMLADWDNQGGLKAEKLTFPASATYLDYKGTSYTAEWAYELYPMKYRIAEMRRLKRTQGLVPDVSGPYLLVPIVKTTKLTQRRQ